jgi:drug/metabolite transporter (DMT)-like permease
VKFIPRAYLDLAAAMSIVGSSVVVGKMITSQIPIFMALTIRFLIAVPILIALSYRNRSLHIPSKKMLVRVFLQSLTGVFLSNVLLLFGLQYTSASESGLLISTLPAMIAIIGWVILREPLSRYEWGGVVLSGLGVLVINMIGATANPSWTRTNLLGNGLVFGAVICEALFTIFRKTSAELPALLGATWVTGFSLLLCLPIGMVQMFNYDWHSITSIQIAALVYYGVFVSVVGYFLWFRGVEDASVGVAGIFSGIVPVSAVVLSTVVLGEPFTSGHMLGLVLVLSAICILSLVPYLASRKFKLRA